MTSERPDRDWQDRQFWQGPERPWVHTVLIATQACLQTTFLLRNFKQGENTTSSSQFSRVGDCQGDPLNAFLTSIQDFLWHTSDIFLIIEDDDGKFDEPSAFMKTIIEPKVETAYLFNSHLSEDSKVLGCLDVSNIPEPLVEPLDRSISSDVALSQHLHGRVVGEDENVEAPVASSLSANTPLLPRQFGVNPLVFEEEERKIRKILGKRRAGTGYESKVRWKDTWLPKGELRKAQRLLQEFETRMKQWGFKPCAATHAGKAEWKRCCAMHRVREPRPDIIGKRKTINKLLRWKEGWVRVRLLRWGFTSSDVIWRPDVDSLQLPAIIIYHSAQFVRLYPAILLRLTWKAFKVHAQVVIVAVQTINGCDVVALISLEMQVDGNALVGHLEGLVVIPVRFVHICAGFLEAIWRFGEESRSVSLRDLMFSGKQWVVVGILHDFLLKSAEGTLFTFSVQQQHIHAEEAQQTICSIFGNRGLSSWEPRHTLTDTGPAYTVVLQQEVSVDLSPACEHRLQACFVSHQFPILVKEHHALQRHQLLKSPTASKPFASDEFGDTLGRIVMQVCKANFRILVPLIHGIYRCGHLSRILLVDTDRVQPYMFNISLVMFKNFFASFRNLRSAISSLPRVGFFQFFLEISHIIVYNLLISPCVGNNDIWRPLLMSEVLLIRKRVTLCVQ